MPKKFHLQLAEIVDDIVDDIRFVTTEATQDLMAAAQTTVVGITRGGVFEVGKIPVADADLVGSLTAGLNGSVLAEGKASYGVAIASFDLGDVMEFGWTQDYALPIEFGWTTSTGKQVPGRHFVGANVARWQEFVDEAVRKVRQ